MSSSFSHPRVAGVRELPPAATSLATGDTQDDKVVRGAKVSRWLGCYGPLLLALYFIATARWGSYLLPGPPYIGDLALGGLIGHRAWNLVRGAAPRPLLSRVIVIPTGLMILLAAGSLATGEWNATAARDAAPYLYAVLVLFGQSYREISARTAELLIYGILIFHAAWYTAVTLSPSLIGVPTLGESQVFLLQARGDIDGAFVGILAALALDRTATGRTPIASALVGGWALALVLGDQSRAGFLAMLCMLGFMGLRYAVLWRAGARPPGTEQINPPPRSWRWRDPALAIAVIVAVPAVMTLTIGAPEAVQRSANVIDNPGANAQAGAEESGSTGPDGQLSPDYGANSGVGTFKAREEAWGSTVEWIHEDGLPRAVLGAGFGPHYMQLSGADRLLLGDFADPAVRAVHNFGVNTWARLGAVGLLLVGVIAIVALIAALKLATRSWVPGDLDLLAALLVIAIPVTALFGVVLESPFGAIPYFWAVGYLSARMVEERIWRPVRSPQWR